MKKRCKWAHREPLASYHDKEWGKPLHNDRKLFELLCLEAAQAGLSWETVLKKRKAFQKAFDGFDPKKVVKYNKRKVESLLKDEGIIRNRLKIEAMIWNAKKLFEIKKEFGTFSKFIWSISKGKIIKNSWKSSNKIPAKTRLSDKMSLELKKRGFKFVGSTICYAYMQSMGMVNDHTVDCFRYKDVYK